MRELVYSSSTPYSTMTPYALEAFLGFSRASADAEYHSAVESVFRFFDRDIQVMYEDDEALATSYGPFRDRTVINAASYTMYSLRSMYALYTEAGEKSHRSQDKKTIHIHLPKSEGRRLVVLLTPSWFFYRLLFILVSFSRT